MRPIFALITLTWKAAFRYRLFWLFVDLDELDGLGRRLRLFSHNRFNLFSLHDRDHGEGSARGLREQADALLRVNGVEEEIGAIRLLCMPRTLGYDFNPLSVYFCYRLDGGLAALIYEVRNTFGGRHSYVLPAKASGGTVRHGCDKAFFVSPFLPMGLHYEFQVAPPGETIAVAIRVVGPDGKTDRFEIDSFRKDCLLKGADEVTLTLSYDKQISAFEAKQRQELSWL